MIEGDAMKQYVKDRNRITFLGHFNSTNFGNESTLLTCLYHLRRLRPNAEFACISTDHEATAAVHHIKSIPLETITRSRRRLNPIIRMARWIFIYAPHELYQWINCFIKLSDTDVLIIPGTGLLTDAYGLFSWGPYSLFKWSMMAKLHRCKLYFISVGAGPIYSTLGTYFIKSALSLADFRSYRDEPSKKYLERIGFRVENDKIYPDLVFSIPETFLPRRPVRTGRCVVGVGLMESSGTYGTAGPSPEIQRAYLGNLVTFVIWLLYHDYNIRLLIGDLRDDETVHEFMHLLRDRLPTYDESRVINEPMSSVEDLLSQIAKTDIVVATRFHNVLLSLLCGKPVISISFHHKCESLMNFMGLKTYCLNINEFNADCLIKRFFDINVNKDKIETLITEKIMECRVALAEQYNIISNLMNYCKK